MCQNTLWQKKLFNTPGKRERERRGRIQFNPKQFWHLFTARLLRARPHSIPVSHTIVQCHRPREWKRKKKLKSKGEIKFNYRQHSHTNTKNHLNTRETPQPWVNVVLLHPQHWLVQTLPFTSRERFVSQFTMMFKSYGTICHSTSLNNKHRMCIRKTSKAKKKHRIEKRERGIYIESAQLRNEWKIKMSLFVSNGWASNDSLSSSLPPAVSSSNFNSSMLKQMSTRTGDWRSKHLLGVRKKKKKNHFDLEKKGKILFKEEKKHKTVYPQPQKTASWIDT